MTWEMDGIVDGVMDGVLEEVIGWLKYGVDE